MSAKILVHVPNNKDVQPVITAIWDLVVPDGTDVSVTARETLNRVHIFFNSDVPGELKDSVRQALADYRALIHNIP